MLDLMIPAPHNCRLFGTTSNGFLDRFTDFAGVLLDPTLQFYGFAFDVLKFVVRECSQFLFQLALDDIAIAFDFEIVHGIDVFGGER
jgi:hypothetical protein